MVRSVDNPSKQAMMYLHTMNSKFLKLLTLTVGILALSAAFVSAEEKKKCDDCPCEKEKPKAVVSEEEKKDGKCPCEKEKPKAADEEKKDGKCPCEKEKPKA